MSMIDSWIIKIWKTIIAPINLKSVFLHPIQNIENQNIRKQSKPSTDSSWLNLDNDIGFNNLVKIVFFYNYKKKIFARKISSLLTRKLFQTSRHKKATGTRNFPTNSERKTVFLTPFSGGKISFQKQEGRGGGIFRGQKKTRLLSKGVGKCRKSRKSSRGEEDSFRRRVWSKGCGPDTRGPSNAVHLWCTVGKLIFMYEATDRRQRNGVDRGIGGWNHKCYTGCIDVHVRCD